MAGLENISFIQNSPIGFAFHEIIFEGKQPVDSVIIECNTTFEKLTGYDSAFLVGKSILNDLEIFDKSSDWLSFFASVALKEDDIKEFEYSSKPLKRVFKVQVYTNQKNHFTTVFTDITNNLNKEERYFGVAEFETTNQRIYFLKKILESIEDGISILSPQLDVLYANDRMNQWYHSQLPLEKKKCYQVYQNRNNPCNNCPAIKAFKSGKTERGFVDGPLGSEKMFFELFAYPMKNPVTGEVEAIVESLRDVTREKEAENKMRRSQEEFQKQTQRLSPVLCGFWE
ncbi:PAS domain-containing protein [Marinilabilia sp.]